MDTMLKEPLVNQDTAATLGLSTDEFERIKKILGRTPNYTELSIFSVMWSEHCCYKSSIKWLKTLPKKGKHILAEAGEENAGLVDLGNGLACAFKIESHNHPSAIEPYQGAATGVGGIHRDIFTMGARPIAALNSLRFGNINLDKTKWLVKGIVKGIGDYGNSFGVPTVGGEVYFDNSYNINPLVNAMSVGIVKKGATVSAISYGAGNPVYIVGSATGKDGIHGATFASEDISENSAEQLPSVQVGDPFQEKKLLEATLEAIDTGHIIGMQDMGAAGIVCSSSEMSDKGNHGMKIYLDKVPMRQKNMQPFEILLSESQERMLVIVKKGKEKEIEAVFDKWDLNCAIIGEVTEDEYIEYYMHEQLVAKIPAVSLVLGGDAPIDDRDAQEPAYLETIQAFEMDKIPLPNNFKDIAKQLIAHPNIASKRWVYEQYDSMVRTDNMSTNAASDAAIVRIKGTNKAVAVTTDCNAYYIHANPQKGTAIAVAEAARNIVCSGGEPLAITNCLNFGNPFNKEVFWQFVETIKGMSTACKKFNTPVTGGNVSFYNQSADGGAVLPTPVIGMLGVLQNIKNRMTLNFKQAGDMIYLLGEPQNDIASSQYLIHHHRVKESPAPYFDMEKEYELHQIIKSLIQQQILQSVHDLSEGGLFVALLESAMPEDIGFEITTDNNFRKDAYLFGEAQSRILISTDKQHKKKLEDTLNQKNLTYRLIGNVTKGSLLIDKEDFDNIDEWKNLYDTALEKHMA